MKTISMFEMIYPTFKIDKMVRLIELFAGVGSQAMGLRDAEIEFEHHRICEWEVNAFGSYKAIHKENDNTDYSNGITQKELIQILFKLGISNDGKEPMTIKQIARKNEKWLRTVFNNIKATNNLVDITQAKGKDLEITELEKYIYMLTYSFPCQDLSVAGNMKGMSRDSGTRSGMLWQVERLLNETEQLPQVLLMENVPQVISNANIKDFHEWQRFLEKKGYKNYTDTLNAKDYGVAQNRNRTFMISVLGEYNYTFPPKIKLDKTMKDYLESEVDEKYYLSDEYLERFQESLLNIEMQNKIPKGDSYKVLGSTVNPKAEGTNSRHWVYDIEGNISIIDATTYKQPKQIAEPVIDSKRLGGLFDKDGIKRQAGAIWDKDFLAPSIDTMQGGYRQPIVTELKQIGNLTMNPKRDNPQTYQVYDKEGLSPTLSCMEGGNLQPMIVASRGRNPDNHSDRTPGSPMEQRLEPNSQGICNTLTSVQKDNLVLEPKLVGGIGEKDWGTQWRQGNRVYDSNAVAMALNAQPVGNTGGNSYLYLVNDTVKIKQATKEGYNECKAGGVADLSYPESKTRRGRVQGNGDICPTLTATETGVHKIESPYRIRKLTPLECWRLMGFTDEDFYKAEKVNSNTQLYKQAGNSIVTKVLKAMFKQMK